MTYRHVVRWTAVALVAVLALSACSSDGNDTDATSTTASPSAGGSMSLAEAATVADGTEVSVEGVLFVTADEMRLCGAIGESNPVQCLGDNVPVTGVDPADHAMGSGGPGVEISAAPVLLEGTMEQGTLVTQ